MKYKQLKLGLHNFLYLTMCLIFGIGVKIHIYILIFKSARESNLHHLRLSILVWTNTSFCSKMFCQDIFPPLKLIPLSSPGGMQGCVWRYTAASTGSSLLIWIFLATLSSPRNVWFPAGNVCLWKLQWGNSFFTSAQENDLTLSEDETHPLEELQSV